MITKLVALWTAVIILFSNFSLIGEKKIPEAASESELLSVESVIEKKQLADEIIAVDIGEYSYAERMTAVCLQGIVAKKNTCLYLVQSETDKSYLTAIEKTGRTVKYENLTLAELIEKFSSYIGDAGYILYRESEWGEGLNVATNYATVYSWLPVEKSIENTAKNCGLILKKDISADEYNFDFQRENWLSLRDNFVKGAVVHEKYEKPGLRDLAIQQNFYCFYTDCTDEGYDYLIEVLDWSGKNTQIFGWVEDEKGFVAMISSLGSYITPADHCWNNSILSSVETEIPEIESDDAVAYTDDTKHYVTLVFSDGDNCQWIQNGFSAFRENLEQYPDSEITWTLSPYLCEMSPLALKNIYSNTNENQSFISGPSGIAYCNLTVYDKDALDGMTTRTAAYMLKSNERIVTLLDDYDIEKDAKFAHRLGYYSRFDNIDGGILFMDPDLYQYANGRIWFSNDKPFASVRLTLWTEEGYDGVTDEWIQEQAEKVNNYPVDISSADGYSVICIHAWSMTPESIAKFISLLDEHVVILNAADFLETVSTNVPHKNTAPQEFYTKGYSDIMC